MSNTRNPHVLGNLTAKGTELVKRTRSLPPGHVFVYQIDDQNEVSGKLVPSWHVCIKGVATIFAVAYSRRNAVIIANWLAGSVAVLDRRGCESEEQQRKEAQS